MGDLTTGIVGMAQGMNDARISSRLQIAMLKETNDIQKAQGEAILQLLNSAPAPSGPKGNNVDITV
jgi:hypothetical protein